VISFSVIVTMIPLDGVPKGGESTTRRYPPFASVADEKTDETTDEETDEETLTLIGSNSTRPNDRQSDRFMWFTLRRALMFCDHTSKYAC
jgi:hypothetical protein